jgi:hypothetical protein
MRGLDPRIHLQEMHFIEAKRMGRRVKPGNDAGIAATL